MVERKHGYTFLGRYNILDRCTGEEGWDWTINDVFRHFGSDISAVLSMGCSVGINEVILGVNCPKIRVTGIDIDEEAIRKAKAGVWNLDDIRPSGLAIPSDDKMLRKIYEHFCLESYFDIDFQNGILKLARPVENVNFEVRDGRQTNFSNSVFDLVVGYMLAGKECHPYSSTFARLGREVERVVKPEGLFWHELGLFRVSPTDDDSSPYRRVLNRGDFYGIERTPTKREFLFPSLDK